MTLEITVPGPLGEGLGLNARVHWAERSKAVKGARQEWGFAALLTEGWNVDQPFDEIRVTYRAQFCRRRGRRNSGERMLSMQGYRPRDLDGLVAAMKPALDGLVDAGLVADDDASRVKFGDHEIEWVDDFGDEGVTVRVEPVEGG